VSFLAASNCQEEVDSGLLKAISLAPEPMIRKLGLIYRKDKALSKAALGFIQVTLEHFGAYPSGVSPAPGASQAAARDSHKPPVGSPLPV
jgi:DNA-binding transcriptional LysR family regulator